MKAMVPKKRTPKDARANLEALVEKIDTLGELTTESAKASLDAVMEENGLGPRDILLPTRIAVTGTKASPPLLRRWVYLERKRFADVYAMRSPHSRRCRANLLVR